jgi:hypothetical protein
MRRLHGQSEAVLSVAREYRDYAKLLAENSAAAFKVAEERDALKRELEAVKAENAAVRKLVARWFNVPGGYGLCADELFIEMKAALLRGEEGTK